MMGKSDMVRQKVLRAPTPDWGKPRPALTKRRHELVLPHCLRHATVFETAETLWNQPSSLILSDRNLIYTASASRSRIEFWVHIMEPSHSSTPASALGTPGRRRNGRLQACEPCRKRKVSCDHAFPACRRCRARNNPNGCVYLGVEETTRKPAQARPRPSVRAAR